MSSTSASSLRWTTTDLHLFAGDRANRYEIIDGELFATRAPHWRHQAVCVNIAAILKLYSVQGVQEYWIVDWQAQTVEIYRREQAVLKLTATLYNQDKLTSPLLPGFCCLVSKFF